MKAGWTPLSAGCHWTAPQSVITLRQPNGDSNFSMRVNMEAGQAENLHQVLRVSSGGQIIGEHRFVTSGMQTLTWRVSSVAESVKDVEITVAPAFYLPNSEAFGVMICECGFLPQARK